MGKAVDGETRLMNLLGNNSAGVTKTRRKAAAALNPQIGLCIFNWALWCL